MKSREEFVMRAIRDGANVAQLCRDFGVSRKTGYKWVARFKTRGVAGLEDLARRPRSNPLLVDADVVTEVVRLRFLHPTWGARKIRVILQRERPDVPTPTERTVHRILVRSGMLQRARQRLARRIGGPTEKPRVEFKAPNDVWTIDFKGWWLAVNNARCEPLTIRDAYSRFILRIEVLPTTKSDRVRAVFEEVFKKYGLPKAILTDNGPPFVTSFGELGWTRLTAWWLSLGITHIRTRPSHPEDNGGHERMHRDIAAELERFAAFSREEQQQACERWRHDFNCHRPHEALGMKTPSDLYRRSRVEYDPRASEFRYPSRFIVRRVQKRGAISFKGKFAFMSNAFVRFALGLEPKGDRVFDVWFREWKLGSIDFKQTMAKLQPISWKQQAVVAAITTR